MKKVVLTMVALMSVVSLFAQEPEHRKFDPEERAKATVSKMSEEITLQFKEQDSLKVIFTKFYTEVGKSMQSQDFSTIKKLKSDRDAKVKTLLSAANYEAYLKFMDKERDERPAGRSRGEGGRGGRGGHGGFGGTDRPMDN